MEGRKKQGSGQMASDMPKGLKELVELAPEKKEKTILLPAANSKKPLPARKRTEKEQRLDQSIEKRQKIIEKLKQKNPIVHSSRKKISSLLPLLKGKAASRSLGLAKEADRIEFSIATEAYTPKKEKELLKRMRAIKKEMAGNKKLDEARRKINEERAILRRAMSEIRSLEALLAKARKECEDAYHQVLAERKAAFEKRQKDRKQKKQKRFDDLKKRVSTEKKRQHDKEMQKYMKDYDDTVPMDEICQIEKKDKKKPE